MMQPSISRALGFQVMGADAGAANAIYDIDLTRPTAIVVGNEARGLSRSEHGSLDLTASIPMPGPMESLNVAMAGSIVVFECLRQRGQLSSVDFEGGDRLSDVGFAELISKIAHELRSPLTSVKGFSATLLKRWDRFTDEQRLQFVETIHADAERMGRIVSEVLDLARLEANRSRSTPRTYPFTPSPSNRPSTSPVFPAATGSRSRSKQT